MAQLVKLLTPDFGSGHDLRVVRSRPALGSALRVNLLEILSFLLPLSYPHPPALSKKKKKNYYHYHRTEGAKGTLRYHNGSDSRSSWVPWVWGFTRRKRSQWSTPGSLVAEPHRPGLHAGGS